MNNKPLTGFGLENFRVFKKKQYFDLKPITIITGANSSGKSSVIKGLKLLKSNMPAFRWDLTLPYKLLISEDKFGHLLGNFKQIINYGNSENDSISFSVPVSLKMVNTKFIVSLSFTPEKGNLENEYYLSELLIYREKDFLKSDPILRIRRRYSEMQVNFYAFKDLLENDFIKNLSHHFGDLYLYNKSLEMNKMDTGSTEEPGQQKPDNSHRYSGSVNYTFSYDGNDDKSYEIFKKITRDEEFWLFQETGMIGSFIYDHEVMLNKSLDEMTVYGLCSINYFKKEKYITQTLDQRIFQWLEEYDLQKPILPFYGIINEEWVLFKDSYYFEENPTLYQKISDYIESLKSYFLETLNHTEGEELNKKLLKHFRKLEDEHFLSIKHLLFPYEVRFNNQPIQSSLRGWDGLVSENKDESEVHFDFWTTPKKTKEALENDPVFGDFYTLDRKYNFQPANKEKKGSKPHTNFRIFNIFIEQCIEKWIVQLKHTLESVIFLSNSNENPARVYTAANGSLFKTLNKYQQIQSRKHKLGDFYPPLEFTCKDFVVGRLKILDIAEDFIIDSLDGGAILQPFFIINKVKRSVADTGYGYMKLLMLLLNIVTAEENSTIVIEEPEANLHPDFQSKLADLMVHAHKLFGHTFVVETHSEYLIRKLQFLTAKGDLNKDDTVIYYLNHPKLKNRKQVNTVKIKLDGRLDGDFGQGFFDEASNLITELFRISEDN